MKCSIFRSSSTLHTRNCKKPINSQRSVKVIANSNYYAIKFTVFKRNHSFFSVNKFSARRDISIINIKDVF